MAAADCHSPTAAAAAAAAATTAAETGTNSAAKRVGKIMAVRVQMLDDSITLFQIQVRTTLYPMSR